MRTWLSRRYVQREVPNAASRWSRRQPLPELERYCLKLKRWACFQLDGSIERLTVKQEILFYRLKRFRYRDTHTELVTPSVVFFRVVHVDVAHLIALETWSWGQSIAKYWIYGVLTLWFRTAEIESSIDISIVYEIRQRCKNWSTDRMSYPIFIWSICWGMPPWTMFLCSGDILSESIPDAGAATSKLSLQTLFAAWLSSITVNSTSRTLVASWWIVSPGTSHKFRIATNLSLWEYSGVFVVALFSESWAFSA